MANSTGETESGALQLDFDRPLTRQFRGSVVTSDAGLLAYHELDDALGLTALAGKMLADARTGKNGRHALRRYYANFSYQAASWTKPRRVVAKVEWHPGELYPRVGFIVTNMSRPAERVVAFYNKRGTAEQWIKEGKGAIKWTRLSCRTFAANAVRLQLHALAYNLGNFLRTLATPEPIKDWSLTSLKDKLIKIGAKVVSHGRYIAFQMAEVAIPRRMFQEILRLIAELRPKPPPAPALGSQWSCVQGHLTEEVRPDAKQNQTLRRRQRQVGLGLQATGHQHERPFREARKIAMMRLKFGVHLGNPR